MTTRIVQNFEESLRKEVSGNLFTNARVMHDWAILGTVDEDALNKCRLSMYGQMRDQTRRMVTGTEDEEDVERARRKRGNYDPLLNVPLYDNIERIYFDTYGESFDGGPVVDRPGASYTCPCGTKMLMEAYALPDECPRCRRLTPLGKLIRDGVLRR